MFRTILYLVALIVVVYLALRKRKPEPFEPKPRIINRTLDPDSPKTIFFLRTGQSNSSEDSEDDSP